MCLLLLAVKTNQQYPLIIAANRDEYHSRPSASAQFWKDDPSLLAGRDLQANGTWLGITRKGRFAAVTNFHEETINPAPHKSRGALVTEFLQADTTPMEQSNHIIKTGIEYQGFTLVFGTVNTLICSANRPNTCEYIGRGIYGLGNFKLNDTSCKVSKSRDSLRNLISQPACITSEHLFSLLNDRATLNDSDSIDSYIFIKGREFGTRCSTVIMIDNEGEVHFSEKTFSTEGLEIGRVDYEFQISQ